MDKITKLLTAILFLFCTTFYGFGQVQGGKTITGTVKDAMGSPIPGATLVIKGTTTGTVTDIDGNYTLGLLEGAETLVVSFVGMGSKEIPIGNQTQISVTLEEDASELDEVIVVGYGTQRKATLTGAVTSVTTEDVRSNPAINLTNSLAGLLPGLTALNRS